MTGKPVPFCVIAPIGQILITGQGRSCGQSDDLIEKGMVIDFG
jgi:hypothetical protein